MGLQVDAGASGITCQKIGEAEVVVDSLFVIDGLAAAFRHAKLPLGVMIECDTGRKRFA
ncbi:MAG: D-serine deaminase-like pyridoxal phosphate-dependent protein [Porticoccaceae bacterium]|jgi:D-serine deaminase-like pyridoxal phosphate-dependent protein